MHHNHLLKFIERGTTDPTNRGIRTFPQQAYGLSRESPDHFRQTYSIICPNTYQYQHENAPQFEYHSQKRSSMIKNGPECQMISQTHLAIPNNPLRFHLKKGRLSEFVDNNGWMNTVYLMSGDERTHRAREINNRDRSLRIANLNQKVQYDSDIIVKPKIHHSYYKTLEDIMAQKVRIRNRRNKEAQKRVPLKQRTLSDTKYTNDERKDVESKMAATVQAWHIGGSKNKYRRELSFRGGSLTKIQDDFQIKKDDLERWQKTNNTKWCQGRGKKKSFENEEQSIF